MFLDVGRSRVAFVWRFFLLETLQEDLKSALGPIFFPDCPIAHQDVSGYDQSYIGAARILFLPFRPCDPSF
jgi:hypothetical protein